MRSVTEVRMPARTALPAALVAGLLAGTTGCLDGSGPNAGIPPTLPGLVVSAPVQSSAVQGNVQASAAAPVSASLAYVSLAPGSVPDGQLATIRNLVTTQSVTAVVMNGGFDPVPIAASAGDTLAIEITRNGSAGPLQALELVRPVRPPVVVRTSPPKGGHDVPLNAAIVVVFSEPIDSATADTGSVQLWSGTTPMAGTVRFADVEHVRAEFHPDSLLAGQTDYRLVVTQGIRDVNGVALASSLEVSFTTGTISPATGLVFASVSAGAAFACGVTTQGAAYCWGDNELGQLGNGTTARSATPVAVAGGLTFASVSAGVYNTCGVTTSGAAYCWGGPSLPHTVGGLLGADSATLSTCHDTNIGELLCTNPVPVAGGLTFRSVSVSVDHVCGVTTNGSAYCWGKGWLVGVDSVTMVRSCIDRSPGNGYWVCPTPMPVAGGLAFAAVSASNDGTCGVTTTGAVYCWGGNGQGQLGTGTLGSSSQVPVAVAGGLSFMTVSALDQSACGITTAGTAYCWGDNGVGELGTGTTTGPEECPLQGGFPFACSTVPVAVTGGHTFTALEGGGLTICGVTPTGAAYCWGDGDDGRMGDGTIIHANPTPVAVAGGLSFQVVSPGTFMPYLTCGLTTSGVAYCWGYNAHGELGTGTTTDSPVPVKVAGQP